MGQCLTCTCQPLAVVDPLSGDPETAVNDRTLGMKLEERGVQLIVTKEALDPP